MLGRLCLLHWRQDDCVWRNENAQGEVVTYSEALFRNLRRGTQGNKTCQCISSNKQPLILYTVGPLTGWFFQSKYSIFSVRHKLSLYIKFCRQKMKQSVRHSNSCLLLHVGFGNSHVTVFSISLSVHLSSLSTGINWFCCSICRRRRQHHRHHHHQLAVGCSAPSGSKCNT